MSELKSALVGALVGGSLTLGGIFLQNSLTDSQATKHDKREKLEELMENVIEAHSCIYSSATRRKEECQSDKSTLRLSILSHVYFPELKSNAIDYSLAIERLKLEISKCESSHFNGRKENADLDCIAEAIKNHDVSRNLQNITEEVELVASSLW